MRECGTKLRRAQVGEAIAVNTQNSAVTVVSKLRRRSAVVTGELDDLSLLIRLINRAASTINAAAMAGRLLKRYGSIAAVVQAPPGALRSVFCVPDAAIDELAIWQTVTNKMLRAPLLLAPVPTNPDQLCDYLTGQIASKEVSQLRVLYLNDGQRLLRDDLHQVGTVNYVPFFEKEILSAALLHNATGLILAHNAPSGNTRPNRKVIAATQNLSMNARQIGVTLFDHVIVAPGSMTSMRALGYISLPYQW